MSERDYKVKTVKVKYYCDVCGHELKYTGNMYPSNPPKYQHNCPDCGKRYKLDKIYPVIEYREQEKVPHRIENCEREVNMKTNQYYVEVYNENQIKVFNELHSLVLEKSAPNEEFAHLAIQTLDEFLSNFDKMLKDDLND